MAVPTEPFPYQGEDVRRIEELGGRALIAGEMGVGKTLEALLYCFDHPSLRPVVVVCPKSLKLNWLKEAQQHVGIKCAVLSGGKPTVRTLPPKREIYIINYEILGGWLDFLKQLNPKIVIADECHYLKTRTGVKRVKFFKQLCKGVPHVLAISGTPLVNRPSELWNVINLLCPKVFNSWRSYADEYCDPQYTRWGIQYNGATNLPRLHKLLVKNCLIRRLKKDILKDLPPKTITVTPLPIDKPQEYKAAQLDFLTWLGKQDPKKAKRARTAESLVKMGYLKRLAAEMKLKSAMEWIDNFLSDSDEKLVIFCIHKKILSQLYNRYQKQAVFIDGSVSQEQRQANVEKFQKSKNCRVFIGNIAAAGVGITLTASSTVVFVELDWVPGNMRQCEDRIHRIGQTSNKVQIFYLVAYSTIEEKLCEILQTKQKILDASLDGKHTGSSTLNIYDELERELRRSLISTYKK